MRKFICLVIVLVLTFALAGTAFASGGKPSDATSAETLLATILTIIIACIFIVAAVLLSMRKTEMALNDGWQMFLLTALAAVTIQYAASAIYPGYGNDLACFKGWAQAVYEYGPSGLYTSGVFCDYPPGYMYILYVLGFIRSIFSIDPSSVLFTMIIKTPAIIADVIIAALVYRIAKREIGKMFGLLCATLILFNPALFFDTAVWAQIDTVFALFIVLTFYHLKRESYIYGALFFAIALLIKPQAIMFLPVIGLAYFYALFKKDGLGKALSGIFLGLIVVAGIFYVGILPFTGTTDINQNALWAFDKYTGTIGSYDYATINAFNLFALLGKNWVKSDTPFLFMNFTYWGIIFLVIICAVIVILQWKTREQRPYFDLSAFLIISLFMLVHMMHERYIVPACILLVFAYAYSRDLTTLFFACAFSMTALVNQMVVLFADSSRTPNLPTMALSAVNMALYIAYAIITVKKFSSGKVLIKSPGLLG